MANPLQQAINSSLRANDAIGASFARIGTAAHPRGFVTSAYRQAGRAMRQALAEQNKVAAAEDVMRTLRQSIYAGLLSEFADMQAFGSEEAERQLGYYGVNPGVSMALSGESDSAVAAVIARVDTQSAIVRAMLLNGASDVEVVGDDDRAGILRYGEVAVAAAYWAGNLVWAGFSGRVDDARQTFKKQAIAALDSRTTNCCLRVHGQIKPLNQPFHLTGEPRFADDMDWPQFHYWCRTSVALYLDEYDDGLTARMRAGAAQILSERARGINIDRQPVDAFG